jgi:hypothetical protein
MRCICKTAIHTQKAYLRQVLLKKEKNEIMAFFF